MHPPSREDHIAQGTVEKLGMFDHANSLSRIELEEEKKGLRTSMDKNKLHRVNCDQAVICNDYRIEFTIPMPT